MGRECAQGVSLVTPGVDMRLDAGGFQTAGKASGQWFTEEVESLGS